MQPANTKNFHYIDLFAGIGGFHYALDALGGRCVFASEIDPAAQKVYKLNHEANMDGPILGDIIALTEPTVSDLIPHHDLLAAGFPCQPFSKSGMQKGINETRGTLFYNIAAILQERKPKIVLLENVRNLTGPKHKDTWETIIRTLRDLGYRVSDVPTIFSPHLLPPSMGGAPQVRDRVYIVGIYVGQPEATTTFGEEKFHIPYKPVNNWHPREWSVEKHLLLEVDHSDNESAFAASGERARAIEIWMDFVNSVGASPGRRLPGFPLWEFAMVAQPTIPPETPPWKRDFLLKNSAFYNENQKEIDAWRQRNPEIATLSNSYRKLEWQAGTSQAFDDCALQFRPSGLRVKTATYLPALVALNQTSYIGKRKRFLSVHEVARLQSFPEGHNFGEQRPALSYKQLGNAVSVSAVKYVLNEYLHYFSHKL